MYVCVCRAITESQIHQAARAGMGSLKELRQGLGVTEECGRCTDCARTCLKQALACPAHPAASPASLLQTL